MTGHAATFSSGLLRLAVRLGYKSITLPNLNFMAVDVLLCDVDCGVVVRAFNIDSAHDISVGPNNIHAVLGHRISLGCDFPAVEHGRCNHVCAQVYLVRTSHSKIRQLMSRGQRRGNGRVLRSAGAVGPSPGGRTGARCGGVRDKGAAS